MIYQTRLGLTKEPFVLTAEEVRRKVNPQRKSLWCIKCWSPHPYNIKLPHVCDRCGHIMFVVRNVCWKLEIFGSKQLATYVEEARADLLNVTYSRALADLHDQEDDRVTTIFGDFNAEPLR